MGVSPVGPIIESQVINDNFSFIVSEMAKTDAHASTHLPGGTDPLPTATTAQSGLVQLTNDLNSTSNAMAPTIAALKTVNDSSVTGLDNLRAQYLMKIRDIKAQYGAVFYISNNALYQTRDASRTFSPMILIDKINRMEFTIVQDVWLFLGGTEDSYTMVGMVGGTTGSMFNVTTKTTLTGLTSATAAINPTVGDTVAIERQLGKFVLSKKNVDQTFSVFMTILDSSYSTAKNVLAGNFNIGITAHDLDVGVNGIIKNILLNYNTDASFSTSGGSSSNSFWKGKKANFLGDSFTHFNNFQYKIQDQLGLATVNSYGVDGARIALNLTDSMCVRYATMDPTADLNTIMGGTNDFSYNVPLGTITDTTVATFYGALHVMFKGIIAMMPAARIIMFTPMQRDMKIADFPGETPGLGPNTAGFTLLQYVDAIIAVCAIYAIPVYDIYRKSGVSVTNITTFTKVTSPARDDRLHPNEAGFVLLARQMGKFIDQF